MATAVAERLNGAGSVTELESVSNDASEFIQPPFRAEVTIEGTTPLLFHRWSVEGVEEKAKAAVRKVCPPVDKDRALSADFAETAAAIANGDLRSALN